MNTLCCPFCGKNKLKVDSKQSQKLRWDGSKRIRSITASVRCNVCHSRGPTISMEYIDDDYKSRNIAISSAEEKAIELWNTRK